MLQEKNNLKIGQTITWKCELKGGYGKIINVRAVVVKLNTKRCLIKAELKNGGFKEVNVCYSNIVESDKYIKICSQK